MSADIFIRSLGNEHYRWYRNGTVEGSGSLEQLENDGSNRLWLLLSGQQVALNELPCPANERRHLRSTAPYELEEQLIGNVDESHFAFTSPVDDLVTAACCDRDWLSQQLEPFNDAGLELHHISVEPLALPYQSGWVLCLVGDSVWVRYGESLGFALELPLVSAALRQLLAEQGEPEQITLIAEQQQHLDYLQQQLPEEIADLAETILQPLAETLATANPPLDLRQADFSNHLPVRRWWGQWRKVAILAGVVLVIFATAQFVQYGQLKQQNKALQQQLNEQLGKVFSRAVPGTPEQQVKRMRSKLRELSGGNSESSVVELLSVVMPVVSQAKGLQLRNFNFNGRAGELRFTCWAPEFDGLQKMQNELASKQLDVKLMDSSADGDGQRGDFRVRKQAASGN